MNNYGLDLRREKKETDGTEHVFGAASISCAFAMAEHLRKDYLPKGELQRGKDDFMDCVTRGYLNILETKFTYAYRNNQMSSENKIWLLDNGYVVWYSELPCIEFSDRFIAMLSNTSRTGNSMKAPAHAIHKYGLIPKDILPANKDMTFDEYHEVTAITSYMDAVARKFLKRFNINYEKVYTDGLETLLMDDMVNLAGYAWPQLKDGEYPKVQSQPNHAFMGFALPLTYIFDNYIVDGDWIKKLVANYTLLDYGYRVYVTEVSAKKKTIWWYILDYLKDILR